MKEKADLRIPTTDPKQYAYIEVHVEGTPEEIVDKYIEFVRIYREKAKKEEDRRIKEEVDGVPF